MLEDEEECYITLDISPIKQVDTINDSGLNQEPISPNSGYPSLDESWMSDTTESQSTLSSSLPTKTPPHNKKKKRKVFSPSQQTLNSITKYMKPLDGTRQVLGESPKKTTTTSTVDETMNESLIVMGSPVQVEHMQDSPKKKKRGKTKRLVPVLDPSKAAEWQKHKNCDMGKEFSMVYSGVSPAELRTMYDTRMDLVAPYAFSRMIYSSIIRKSDPTLKDREILKEGIKEAKKNKVKIAQIKQPPLTNPYKDPEWNITLPSPSWSGHVGTGHFNGYLNPICRQYMNQCTSNTRFDIFSHDGVVTCKIFLKGKHCDAFYPDPRVLPMNPRVKKEAAVLLKDRTVSNDQVKRSLNEKFKVADGNNKAFEPSLQQLSQERYRAKIGEIGHSRDAFKNALAFLEELPNDVRVIKKVGLDSVENMTESNFTFILYSETALKRCKDNLSHIAGWDALWKFASMTNLKKREGKIPLSAWISLDGNNRPTVIFLVISDDYNHRVTTTAVRAIKAELIDKKYIENFKKLSVMIDDGAAEKKAFSNLSLNV